jgi:hypothetical protein
MTQRLPPHWLAGACATAILSAPLAALAAAQQSDVVPPGGFVASCAAETSGANYQALGGNLANAWSNPAYAGKYACDSQMFDGAAGGGSASASHDSAKTSSSASGQASMGLLGMTASNTSPANTYFAQGAANGGWSDSTTVTVDGFSGSAVWLIDVAVSGSASVFGGAAAFSATAYKNETELSRYVSGFDPGDSDVFSTDRQRVRWGVGAPNNTTAASRTVADVVTFAVPVTLGTSFVWGVYGGLYAGQRAAGTGDTRITTADIDFSNGMRFLGTRGVLVGGVLQSDYQLVSSSGLDWTVATPVPEPGTWALMLAGLFTVGGLARRRMPGLT